MKYLLILSSLCFLLIGCTGAQSAPSTAEFSISNYGLPQDADIVLEHQGFTVGYSYKYRQALWVCYTLTAEQLLAEQVKRSNRFQADPLIVNNPVLPSEYRKTGYDKGHLAPAADMTYSINAMTKSFYMSNVSPQTPGFNRGIWKRLETFTRDAAKKEGIVLIVTGPIFNTEEKTITMKGSDIPIPVAFYKILFDLTPPQKIISFVVPNATSKKSLPAFTVTVGNIETLTDLCFFPNLDIDSRRTLETNIAIDNWQSFGVAF